MILCHARVGLPFVNEQSFETPDIGRQRGWRLEGCATFIDSCSSKRAVNYEAEIAEYVKLLDVVRWSFTSQPVRDGRILVAAVCGLGHRASLEKYMASSAVHVTFTAV
jgi:hypothetical protein